VIERRDGDGGARARHGETVGHFFGSRRNGGGADSAIPYRVLARVGQVQVRLAADAHARHLDHAVICEQLVLQMCVEAAGRATFALNDTAGHLQDEGVTLFTTQLDIYKTRVSLVNA